MGKNIVMEMKTSIVLGGLKQTCEQNASSYMIGMHWGSSGIDQRYTGGSLQEPPVSSNMAEKIAEATQSRPAGSSSNRFTLWSTFT